MANANAGYRGIARVEGGNYIRCTNMNVNLQQDTLFYDHTLGLNDYVSSGDSTKIERPGFVQTQKNFWRPSPLSIGGSIAYPLTAEEDGYNLFQKAKTGAGVGNIEMYYYCDDDSGSNGRSFEECRVGSFQLNITAGDFANIQVDFGGKRSVDISGTPTHYKAPTKMISWDKVSISGSGLSENIQAFSMNINNNLSHVYTARPSSIAPYEPKDVRLGMQEVTGTISVYNKKGPINVINGGKVELTLSVGNWSTPLFVILKTVQLEARVGPFVTTIPFIGVERPFGS